VALETRGAGTSCAVTGEEIITLGNQQNTENKE